MKWFIGVLAVLVLLLQYRIWLTPDGAREVRQMRAAVAAQKAENQTLIARNQLLVAEVHDLKQGFGALEERARSELGLIAANETYFQVVPPRDAPAATPAVTVAAGSARPAALRAAAH